MPFTTTIDPGMTREHMTDDQRQAGRRTDVLVYQTAPLTEDVTIAGPLKPELFVSTSGTDADFARTHRAGCRTAPALPASMHCPQLC